MEWYTIDIHQRGWDLWHKPGKHVLLVSLRLNLTPAHQSTWVPVSRRRFEWLSKINKHADVQLLLIRVCLKIGYPQISRVHEHFPYFHNEQILKERSFAVPTHFQTNPFTHSGWFLKSYSRPFCTWGSMCCIMHHRTSAKKQVWRRFSCTVFFSACYSTESFPFLPVTLPWFGRRCP
jgi:hypothetical protein